MTDDLVKRLRKYVIHMDAWGQEANHDADIVEEAADRILKLEAALREIAGARPKCCCISDAMQFIARKALEGKDE